MDNRRSTIRVDFQTKIVVKIANPAVQLDGDSTNLSLKGLFVKTEENVPLNTPCRIDVILSGTVSPISISMEGTVVRRESTGIAINFNSMDIDSYAELKNIVRYNTENPDDIF